MIPSSGDFKKNLACEILRLRRVAICDMFLIRRSAILADYIITTTGLAGGLFTPYKGSLPALESKDSSNGSPVATSFPTKP